MGEPGNPDGCPISATSRRRVRLIDVAAAAGVSLTVASRALAGYADVAEVTRARITTLAVTMGYHPSARARALASGLTGRARCAVAVLGMDSAALAANPYLGPILLGIMAQAVAAKLDVHLWCGAIDGEEKAAALARLVAEDRAEGFLILTFLPIAPGDVAPLIWAGVPFVLVNRHFGANPVNCVVVDFAAAMSGAVDHLVRLGHRRIATLLPDDAWSAIQDRASGWREGVRRNGLAEAAAPIIHFALPEGEAGHALGRRLLTGGLPGSGSVPTAIVGYNDFCAHGVLAAAAELGVAVPSSLSVIGFDDIIAPYTSPPLCSYGPAPLALGMAAVDRLVLLLAGGNPEPTRTALSAELVCRGTCGAPP